MKKLVISMMALCFAAMMTQCRKVDVQCTDNEVVVDDELIEFSLSANSGDEKSSIDGFSIKWSAGDRIYVVDMDAASGSGLLGSLSALTGGSGTSEFRGGIIQPTAGHRCLFYYVGTNTFAPDADGEYTYSVATQNGALNGDNGIANKMLLMKSTDYVTVTDIMLMNNNFGSTSIDFKNMISITRLNLQVNGTSLSGTDADVVTVCSEGSYATAVLNVKTGELEPEVGAITLNKASGNYYMALIPTDQSSASPLSLEFVATSRSGEKTGIKPTVQANMLYNSSTAKAINMKTSPSGSLTGMFSVGYGQFVYFAKGNLQYLGNSDGTGSWRFATRQWDIMGNGPSSGGNVTIDGYSLYNYGSGNAGGSETEYDKASARDMFGWGTTGTKDTRSGASTYQLNYKPYSTYMASTGNASNTYGYGPDYNASSYNLTVASKSDWGCIETLPGNSSTTKVWYTLSKDGWTYLIDTRNTSSGIRFAKGVVDGINGLILLPDDWNASTYALNNVNEKTVDYSVNGITSSNWVNTIEPAGAVFLPAAGYRQAGSVINLNSYLFYWYSTCKNADSSYDIYVRNDLLDHNDYCLRFNGFPVRLVRAAQ